MAVYMERFGAHRTVFIYASDDSEWVNRYFGNHTNVYPTNQYNHDFADRLGFDLAALASCNHSIIRFAS